MFPQNIHNPDEVSSLPEIANSEESKIKLGLTQDQLWFLKRHRVPLEKVFDATGLTKSMYMARMEEIGAYVAYGIDLCPTAGHKLTYRDGSCVQCCPNNLIYIRRHYESGDVYVASSTASGLVKIGISIKSSTRTRVEQLNRERHGGASDWTHEFAISCARAGKAESIAHSKLARFKAFGTYEKNGQDTICRELFRCEILNAVDAVKTAVESLDQSSILSGTIESEKVFDQLFIRRVDELGLPGQANRIFIANGIVFLADLVQKTDDTLLIVCDGDQKLLSEIKIALVMEGLVLGMRL